MHTAMQEIVIQTEDWSIDHPAVHQEHLGPRDRPLRLAMVRHPTYPFRAFVRDDGNDLRPLLFELARQYLLRIPALAALPLPLVTENDPGASGFGWLALTWGDPGMSDGLDPRLSFWVTRTDREGGHRGRGRRQDRTAVLLAGHRIPTGDATASAGAAVGLRVVLHVGEPQGGRSHVRVTGLSLSGFEQMPHAAVASPGAEAAAPVDPVRLQPARFSEFREDMLVAAKAAFGFTTPPALTGILNVPGAKGEFILSGNGERGPEGARRVFSWTARLDFLGGGQVLPVDLIEQRSNMIGPDSVMTRDPASCGPGRTLAERSPTRSDKKLDAFRIPTAMLPPPVGGVVSLADPRVLVLRSRAGNSSVPAPPTLTPFEVPHRIHPLRSDDLAAVHAYLRGQEFFQRLDAYGLNSDDYFKMARLPLKMLPRASFHFVSSGETVNAEVSPDGQGQCLSEQFARARQPSLQVAFGNADLSHRQMLPNDSGVPRAQFLGLAADPRWSWHEFGHVLNFASTGELEFRFAHSAGDALAAIIADPESRLDLPERVRNLTFPWAMLRRSHARPAHLGWCWCGQRSRLRRSQREGRLPTPGGYFEEELMASSLFRLYEAIGGAGVLDGTLRNKLFGRRDASDYTVYLIMRAIALLGSAALVPARSADAFVSAMIDADIGTGRWHVQATWPEGVGRRRQRRLGGAVHKVIRWAFERQGLYATKNVHAQHEGPGLPPDVDIYIPGTGARLTGGYDPVALRWSRTQAMPWHADSDSILANGDGLCKVRVRNRGSDTATGVTVRLWASDASLPVVVWRRLDPAAHDFPRDITPAGNHYVAFERRVGGVALAPGRYLLLAAVTCAADPANTDPAAALPCGDPASWSDPSLLTHLVANDNNLGLRIVEFL